MLANYLIGVREGLEAGLVVSILVAYLVRSDRRWLLPRLWAGVAAAVVVSLGFGALLTFGPRTLTHETRELVGGTLSIVAVAFVTVMIFWMAAAARGMAAGLRDQVDRAADAGRWSLALVGLLAVGREGLETALFLWAATSAGVGAGGSAGPGPLLAACGGLATAAAIAWLLYRGALAINLTVFFTWTGAFLVLVAAGVLSYGVHDLQEAGVLPGEHTLLFDLSGTISPSAWYAVALKGAFNFSPTTTVLQGLAWLLYVVPTMSLFLWRAHLRGPGRRAREAAGAATSAASGAAS